MRRQVISHHGQRGQPLTNTVRGSVPARFAPDHPVIRDSGPEDRNNSRQAIHRDSLLSRPDAFASSGLVLTTV